MSDSPQLGWLASLFKIHGSVLPAVSPRVGYCVGFASMVLMLKYVGVPIGISIEGGWGPAVLGVINLVIGLLLVFRTNTAYERFWEGRKLWGDLINTARNLARQLWITVQEEVPEDREAKIKTLYLLVAYAISLKLHLRQERPNHELKSLLDPERIAILKTMNNPPLQVAIWIADYLHAAYNHRRLSVYQLTAMYKLLDQMVIVLGGCERILKTPIPLAYSIHLKQILFTYCLMLPIQLVNSLDWITILIVALVSFILLGIEEIGVEIENPFGQDPNDLPLDTICSTMLRNIEDVISLSCSSSLMSSPTRE